ncbi:MAG: TIGR03118 family protein, partial [Terriglobales bacterium]
MSAKSRARRALTFLSSLVIGFMVIPRPATAQFKVTNLVSSQAGRAKYQDPDLVNAWGIAYSPTGPICVTSAGSGLATFYDAQGVKQSPVITIPSASKRHGTPTGVVYNRTTDFQVSQGGDSGPAMFIFDTVDGTISGWNPDVNSDTAIVVVNNSSHGGSYAGLAIGVYKGANFIYAADHKNNKVDMFDGSFHLVKSFTDKKLPAGSAPF